MMDPEQYEKVGQLFHAALELPPERRAAFLGRACGADEGLRQEVESLLAAHEQAGDFVAGPAVNVAAEWLARQEEVETVSGRIGAYEVLSLIGRGGMGEVYLAHDTRLGRKVAVKLLRPALTSNPDAVRRFEQEARAASSLNHPNIVTIYEIGDLRERRFIAMEFVEGQSLAGDDRPPRRRRHAGAHGRAARPGALGGARRGHRPPRHQARERHGPRGRLREGARLRPGAPGSACRLSRQHTPTPPAPA